MSSASSAREVSLPASLRTAPVRFPCPPRSPRTRLLRGSVVAEAHYRQQGAGSPRRTLVHPLLFLPPPPSLMPKRLSGNLVRSSYCSERAAVPARSRPDLRAARSWRIRGEGPCGRPRSVRAQLGPGQAAVHHRQRQGPVQRRGPGSLRDARRGSACARAQQGRRLARQAAPRRGQACAFLFPDVVRSRAS